MLIRDIMINYFIMLGKSVGRASVGAVILV